MSDGVRVMNGVCGRDETMGRMVEILVDKTARWSGGEQCTV